MYPVFSNLAWTFKTKAELTDLDKHSSLLQYATLKGFVVQIPAGQLGRRRIGVDSFSNRNLVKTFFRRHDKLARFAP
jgi:hypothetical protein